MPAEASMTRQAGFTLLEAVVAMTLLVVVGGALLAWLNSGFITVGRMVDVRQRIDESRLALAYLESVNPAAQAEGVVHLGTYTLEWKSKPLTESRPVVGRFSGNPGAYDAALYQVIAQIDDGHGEPVELAVELPGYRLVRDAQDIGASGQ